MAHGEATTDSRTDYVAILCICPNCSWDLAWFKLEAIGRVLPLFQPGKVIALPLLSATEEAFWPRPKRRRAAKRAVSKAVPTSEATRDQPSSVQQPSLTVPVYDATYSDSEHDFDEAWEGELSEEVESENTELLLRAEAMEPLHVPEAKPASSNSKAATGSSQVLEPQTDVSIDAANSSHQKRHYDTCRWKPPHRWRAANGRAAKNMPYCVGGRPVPFLCMWLRAGAACESKADHMNKSGWTFTLAARRALRAELHPSESGRDVLSYERVLDTGEPEEPETLQAYM
eukprot:6492294-Amphidinium_carterae.4